MEAIIKKNNNSEFWLQMGINVLIILWIYTAGSKLMDLDDFQRQLTLQPFGKRMNSALFILLPGVEILTGALLVIRKTRLPGLFLSALMLITFTVYVLLVLTGYFTKVPCSCGGVLKSLSWKNHLIFNLVFLGINLIALYKTHVKKGGSGK
jgi:putative oxidoreductase